MGFFLMRWKEMLEPSLVPNKCQLRQPFLVCDSDMSTEAYKSIEMNMKFPLKKREREGGEREIEIEEGF